MTINMIMKSSVDRANKYCHYVTLRIAGFAITPHYDPAEEYILFLAEGVHLSFSLWVLLLGFSLDRWWSLARGYYLELILSVEL